MIRLKTFTILKSIFVFLFFNVICILVNPLFGQDTLVDVKLQLKWKHQFQFAGYYMEIEKGFYKEEGLSVTLIEPVNIENSFENVIDGNADFGITMSNLLLYRSKGYPVVALATIFQHSPLSIMTLEGVGIKSIHNLSGKRVSFEPNSAELLAYLESEGLSVSSIKFKSTELELEQLLTSEVDAISVYSTDEPFLLRQKNINYNVFTPRAGGIDFYGDTLFTTEGYIKKYPKRVNGFLKATEKGWQYALNNENEVIDIILNKYSKRHSREHLEFEAKETKKLILPNIVEIGYMNTGRWRNIADIYAKLGMIPKDFPLEGFLYDKNGKKDLTWFYLSLFGVFFVLAIVSLIALRIYNLNIKLKKSLNELNTLRGIIPICASCKKIRDDKGYWHQVEVYVSKHSDANFSHGICPECKVSLYPEIYDKQGNLKNK